MSPLARVLLVMTADAARVLARCLERRGFCALAATDGPAAVALLGEALVDAVLYDLDLGAPALEQVRDGAAAAGRPALLVRASASGTPPVGEFPDGGVFCHIPRTASPNEIDRLIRRAIEHRRDGALLAIHRAARELLRPRAPEEVPQAIVDAARAAFAADDASLMLPGADGLLYVAHASGLPEQIMRTARIAIGERVAGRVAADRKPALIGDLNQAASFSGVVRRLSIGSSVVYPLGLGDRLAGVLSLARRRGARPYVEADVERIGVLAEAAAQALDNLRLTRETVAGERLACVGRLTTGLAHDINNPLAFVLSNLGHIHDVAGELAASASGVLDRAAPGAEPDVLEDLRCAASEALEGAARIRETVRDLRVLVAGTGVGPTIFSVNDVVRSALRVASGTIRENADVVADLGEDVDILGSVDEICHLMVELLLHTADACGAPDARRPRLRVSSRPDPGGVVVTLAAETAGGARGTMLPATGDPRSASMWISREIVRRHGGELEVAPRGDVPGARLSVRLPAAAGTARAAADAGAA